MDPPADSADDPSIEERHQAILFQKRKKHAGWQKLALFVLVPDQDFVKGDSRMLFERADFLAIENEPILGKRHRQCNGE